MARIHLSLPELSGLEREYVWAAIDSGWLAPVGPDLEAFERELTAAAGTAEAVGVASGTAGLHVTLHALGVRPGDDVLLPTLTFVATANAVSYCGARPVFVDVDAATWCLDPELTVAELDRRAASGSLPAAVVTVDLYGQAADHDPIVTRCAELGVPVVEDAAEALGATYRGRRAGSLARAGVFSFNGNKLITTSGGGAVVTDDAALAARIRYLSSQAREPVLHYEHRELGFNYRLSNVLAALGRAQLATLPERVERRRRTKLWYRSLWNEAAGVEFMPDAPYGEPTNWLTCLTVDPAVAGFTRDDVIARLESADIESRPVWKPMHLQPQFAGHPLISRGGSVADRLFERGVCLPSGEVGDEGRARIASALRALWAGG